MITTEYSNLTSVKIFFHCKQHTNFDCFHSVITSLDIKNHLISCSQTILAQIIYAQSGLVTQLTYNMSLTILGTVALAPISETSYSANAVASQTVTLKGWYFLSVHKPAYFSTKFSILQQFSCQVSLSYAYTYCCSFYWQMKVLQSL